MKKDIRTITTTLLLICLALVTASSFAQEHNRKFRLKIVDKQPMLNLIDEFLEIPGGPVPGSSSRLVRRYDSIAVNISTSEVDPGPTTVWFLIFNRPWNCAQSPCQLIPDLIDEDNNVNTKTGATAMRAGNAVVAASGERAGQVQISSYLEKNGPSLPGSLFGKLVNPLGAEVHVVIKEHGPMYGDTDEEKLANLVDQLYDVNGGCQHNFPNNPPPLCPDPQMSIHLPPYIYGYGH